MRVIYLKVDDSRVNYIELDTQDLLKYVSKISIDCIPIIIAFNLLGDPASAAQPSIQEKVDRATQPVIDAIKAVGGPICYGSMLWGWSKVMLGQRREGYQQIKDAGFGFIGLVFANDVYRILSGVK